MKDKLITEIQASMAAVLNPAQQEELKNFICFSKEENGLVKILAGYHQYFAVRKAIESTRHATETDGKGGVFWHTQGSGKSISTI